MRKTGFTLIELLILVAIFGIVAAIIVPQVLKRGKTNGTSNITYGVTGTVETRCVGGHLFVVSGHGGITQVLNQSGGGVQCQP